MLLLAGCGGGEDSSTSSEPAGQASTEGAGNQAQAPGDGQGSSGGESEGESGEGEGGKGGGAPPGRPEGEREPGITPEQRKKATVANIALESPSLVKPDGFHLELRRASTCHGKDVPPTLRWRGVSPEAEELVLFMINFKPVKEALFFNWAVAGIDPGVGEIKAGELPAGAVAGTNSLGERGYSVCPHEGKGEMYVFTLYALPEALDPEAGFDPAKLRREAQREHGHGGLLGVSYNRY